MHLMSIRIVLAIIILIIFCSSPLLAATEQRTALVIGNSAYSSGPLKNPVNDATDMATALQKLGFNVTIETNANLETMETAIENFGNQLRKGGVGLFYYAGHGVQVKGVNYLIPIGARINKESDVRYRAVDAGRVLDEMAYADNGMNIVLLDACRDNPFGKSYRSASRGLAIVSNSPAGTFISYSTSPGNVARDGEGRNSPYTKALLENINIPGLTINKVFMKVRSKVKKETGQIPWELSSLVGDFYFLPVSAQPSISKTSPADEFDEESRRLEAERRRIEEEKAAFARKKALDEKRKKIADEKERFEAEREAVRQAELEQEQAKKTLAMVSPPSVSTDNATKRDGRFIAYSNGTVLDTNTNLMWAAKDNGSSVNAGSAKEYCDNYRGGGYTDWRMPTVDELAGLYANTKIQNMSGSIHLSELIVLTSCCLWASETFNFGGYDRIGFNFDLGALTRSSTISPYPSLMDRVLPVRSGK